MSFLSKIFAKTDRTRLPSVLLDAVDYHSHILPGVDDGVQELDESLYILSQFEARGCRTLWLTPHIMEDFPNKSDDLRSRFEQLKRAYQGNIELHLASENMIDNLFVERLEANDLLPFDDGKLLVETSYYDAPNHFIQILEEIQQKGYTPLLAHPERFNYMDRKYYDRLKSMGILFQLNLMSPAGHYGPMVKQKAHELFEAGYYNFTGTDLHHRRHIEVLDRISDDKKSFQKIAEIRAANSEISRTAE